MDPRLLEQLVCPVTKGPLVLQKADTVGRKGDDELISLSARLAYPIRDGIAVMMENEARVLSEDEYNTLREKHPARV
jgi:uncharacterized protein